jgi:hypothetical protein
MFGGRRIGGFVVLILDKLRDTLWNNGGWGEADNEQGTR